jgi:hypothetical protein
MAAMEYRKLKDIAVLIGFDPSGACIYSDSMPLHTYWDGEHVWDDDVGTKNLHLQKMHGYLFGASGELLQEFESVFDLETGAFKSGWARHEDGTYLEHKGL